MDSRLERSLRTVGIVFLLCAFLPVAFIFSKAQLADFPWAVLGRTLFQAALSAFLSILIGLPLAWALGENWFFSKLIRPLTLLPAVLPPLAMILVATSLFGNSGIFHIPQVLYSLWGVILVHALYNFPLAARLLRQPIISSQGYVRLAEGMSANLITRITRVVLPLITPSMLGVFWVIFLYSFTSFSIPLIFGGTTGSTLETSIYQSFFSQLDFGKAAFLSIIQFALLLPIMFLLPSDVGLFSRPSFADRPSILRKSVLVAYFIFMVLMLLSPLPKLRIADVAFAPILNSLIIASFAATFSLVVFALLPSFLKKTSYLFLAISPATLALAYSGLGTSWLLVVFIHSVLALHLFQMVLGPRLKDAASHSRVAMILGADGRTVIQKVVMPFLKREIVVSWVLAFFLSLSEVAFVKSVSGGTFDTLSSVMLSAFSNYRFGEGVFYTFFIMFLSLVGVCIVEWLHDS